jgi:hypothetical protein
LLWIHVKENPPVADAAAKGGGLVVEAGDVAAGERIVLHFLEGRLKQFPLGSKLVSDEYRRSRGVAPDHNGPPERVK